MFPHNDMIRPTPFRMEKAIGQGPDGKTLVVLTFKMVTGETVLVLPAEGFSGFAKDIKNIDDEIKTTSGIVLPPKGLFVAGGVNGKQFKR